MKEPGYKMKIRTVDIIDVANELHASSSKWRPVVVRVNTDEGISGFGEIGLAYGAGASAGIGMAKDLAALIIGMDPLKNEAIWEKMLKKTFWAQGGGTVIFAGMSGIDIALWDIKGKAFGVPIYQLLGGKTRDKIKAYASQVQFGWGPGKEKATLVQPAAFAEAAQCAVAEGYSALKVNAIAMDGEGNWNSQQLYGPLSEKTLRLGYNRIKAIREAVGADIDIIVEMNAFTDTRAAIQFGRMIEELGIFYYEEPVMPLNPKQMKRVSDDLNIPIAAGERIYSRWGFLPFFESGSLDIVQPDIGNCGGLTETKKVCDMAHVYDVTVQIHVCGGPIATAAALQLEAAIPNFIIHETHRYTYLEPNIRTCKHNYQPVNGFYEVPELPGLGQELTDETIKASTVETVK
jgi:L-alanine-DL-glutamate epimerase-like enolase superfamily enzyme